MTQTPEAIEKERREANRIGIDYHLPPPRRLTGPIIDFHTHIYDGQHLGEFFAAADLYKITHFFSMTPITDVERVREAFADRIRFIAIPNWRRQEKQGLTSEFRTEWMADLATFAGAGSRLCKFWMAPPIRERNGLTLKHEFLQPVIDHALGLGFEFMVHVADPSVWWGPGRKYEDTAKFGTKAEHYEAFEWFLERVRPRRVVGVHMAGSIENVDFLQQLFDRHDNLLLDSSATKWIVREVARYPEKVRAFIIRNSGRILFGSDLVAADRFVSFDHYASRYWAHQMMWESGYRGESPIEDPDGENPPQLAGTNLPDDVLRNIYVENITRTGWL